jgi:tRNA1(Val) A37 N6-methylase TrmN6
MPEEAASSLVTEDAFLNGRLLLRQPRHGHRAGTDAVLLAAAVPVSSAGLVLDVGSGVGTAGLAIAAERPQVRLGLVEVDPVLAELAAENLAANGLADRGRVHVCDVVDAESGERAGLVAGQANLVVTNPPFFDPARARPATHAGKRAAHVMPTPGLAALEAWIAACLALLAEDGLFVIIHRPEAVSVLLRACAGLGGLTLLSVHPHEGRPASLILLRGKKGNRAPLTIAAPLILHAQNKFSAAAEAIHRGETLLDW